MSASALREGLEWRSEEDDVARAEHAQRDRGGDDAVEHDHTEPHLIDTIRYGGATPATVPYELAAARREPPKNRLARIRETLSVLKRAHPRSNPSVEDIVRLHELHALHEREAGRAETAAAAEARAGRLRTQRQSDRA